MRDIRPVSFFLRDRVGRLEITNSDHIDESYIYLISAVVYKLQIIQSGGFQVCRTLNAESVIVIGKIAWMDDARNSRN